jgi:hypothetical protein
MFDLWFRENTVTHVCTWICGYDASMVFLQVTVSHRDDHNTHCSCNLPIRQLLWKARIGHGS